MEAYAGVLHRYAPPLYAFEFQPSAQNVSAASKISETDVSTVVFIGGLSDNLLTVPFAPVVAEGLPPGWRLMQMTLSSSGSGWGTSSLDTDVEEMGRCVVYLRRIRPRGKIVLLGHSTGSQDTLHYLSTLVDEADEQQRRPRVDGAILQSPVSDREGIEDIFTGSKEQLQESIQLSQKMVATGGGEGLLPRDLVPDMPPLTASRWLSLTSPGPDHAGLDDMFSGDLSDERLQKTFGAVGRSKTPFMILAGECDQFVRNHAAYRETVSKWIDIVKANGGKVHSESGLVPDMDHSGTGAIQRAMEELARRVTSFLISL